MFKPPNNPYMLRTQTYVDKHLHKQTITMCNKHLLLPKQNIMNNYLRMSLEL